MKKILGLLLASVVVSIQAADFSLISEDVKQNEYMSSAQEYSGFGCRGKNISPQLSWMGAPPETKSFAVTLFDPDAPTGSGWWHWQIVNIPADINVLPHDAGNLNKNNAPKNSLQIINDFGQQGFGGACPPLASKAHRYQFTVYALSVDHLDVRPQSSGALVGYMIKAHALASASIEARYKR